MTDISGLFLRNQLLVFQRSDLALIGFGKTGIVRVDHALNQRIHLLFNIRNLARECLCHLRGLRAPLIPSTLEQDHERLTKAARRLQCFQEIGEVAFEIIAADGFAVGGTPLSIGVEH